MYGFKLMVLVCARPSCLSVFAAVNADDERFLSRLHERRIIVCTALAYGVRHNEEEEEEALVR